LARLEGDRLISHVLVTKQSLYKSKWEQDYEVDGIGPCPTNLFMFHCQHCDRDYPLHDRGSKAVTDHIGRWYHKENKERVYNELREVG
jgi:hypothetical protein